MNCAQIVVCEYKAKFRKVSNPLPIEKKTSIDEKTQGN